MGSLKVRTCEICETETEDMVADHCHETGAVRDWICRSCNAGLGMFKDKPEALRRGAAYLERHRANPRIGLAFLRAEVGKLSRRSPERRANKLLKAHDDDLLRSSEATSE